MKNTDMWMVILTIVIAFSAVLTYMSLDRQTKAIEGSYLPQIYVQGGKCFQEIDSSSNYSFNISFGNYGKIPLKNFILRDITENIIILQRFKDGAPYENNFLEGIMIPIEYKDNKATTMEYFFSVNDSKLSNATFYLEWGKVEEGKETVTNNILCYYEKINNSFKLKENPKIIVLAYSVKWKS